MSNNCIEVEAAEDLAAVISSNIRLEEVLIGENHLESNGIIQIANALSLLGGLRVLDLKNTSIALVAAVSISKVILNNTMLESLFVGSECEYTTTKGVENLLINKFILEKKVLTKMIGCCSSDTSVTHESSKCTIRLLTCDVKQIPKCNKLVTEGCIKICQALANNTSLKRFSIENNDIDDEAADYITAVLTCNAELEQLWIGSNLFSPRGISKLLNSFEKKSNLQVLDLSHCDISLALTYDVAKVLIRNKKIKQIWLENNAMPQDGITFLLSLEKCLDIEVMCLRSCNITESAAITLSRVLPNMLRLQQLYLGQNNLHDACVMQVVSSLINATSLQTLDLSSTNITEVSVNSIVEVIASSSQLQQLFLGGNKLCSSGAIKIVTALKGSHTIQVLGLSHNHITCEAAGEISTAVSNMPYLVTLMLDGNELDMDGVCTIIEGVQELNWLMILSLTENNMSEEDEDQLKEIFTKFKLFL
ncbi:ribonuclease inhibitor-like [Dysidea avara]|uniref:ribonuclease inhibitor-like n=1 Tax=Dysidea avara TaxID=196820 RepID=UPI00332661B1